MVDVYIHIYIKSAESVDIERECCVTTLSRDLSQLVSSTYPTKNMSLRKFAATSEGQNNSRDLPHLLVNFVKLRHLASVHEPQGHRNDSSDVRLGAEHADRHTDGLTRLADLAETLQGTP